MLGLFGSSDGIKRAKEELKEASVALLMQNVSCDIGAILYALTMQPSGSEEHSLKLVSRLLDNLSKLPDNATLQILGCNKLVIFECNKNKFKLVYK